MELVIWNSAKAVYIHLALMPVEKSRIYFFVLSHYILIKCVVSDMPEWLIDKTASEHMDKSFFLTINIWALITIKTYHIYSWFFLQRLEYNITLITGSILC